MGASVSFAPVVSARQRGWANEFLPCHCHRYGNAAVVLSGGYEEAGDRGRRFVEAGDVVLRGAFEAHLDRFSQRGAEVLNFDLPDDFDSPIAFARVRDPDRIVRLAASNPREALSLLLSTLDTALGPRNDWPDRLASAITEDPALCLYCWADDNKLAGATVSRGFQSVYGISPATFRAHARARLAWRALMGDSGSLSAIAYNAGYADQAHMTRAIRALTGKTPGEWCRIKSNRFKN